MPPFVSQLWLRRYLSRNAIDWRELEAFPSLTPARQREDLGKRLLSQIQYFGRRDDALPEWREAAKIGNPEDLWKVWPSLPILDKKSLQTRFIASETQRICGLEGQLNATGGSTGEAVQFYHDTRMVKSTTAVHYYARYRMGWRPGMPTVIIWGSERDIKREVPLRNRLHLRLSKDYLIDGYNLTDETARRVGNLARQLRPVAMYGFTSMLAFIAERLIALGEAPLHGAVRTAWNGGEMLYPEQNEVFTKAFGVPIRNLYGGRELATMACQSADGGPLDVLRPWVFLEIVDENGKPAGPGQSGRLIWTSTICRGTPFLRFDVGDLGAAAATHRNESGISAIDELHGRTAGLLKLPNGRTINNIFWNHLFKEYPEVAQFQVLLRSHGGIRILLCGRGFAAEREARLRDIIGDMVDHLPLELQWVDSIPLTRQGKRIQVLRETA